MWPLSSFPVLLKALNSVKSRRYTAQPHGSVEDGSPFSNSRLSAAVILGSLVGSLDDICQDNQIFGHDGLIGASTIRPL
jgi:hypothetical protein